MSALTSALNDDLSNTSALGTSIGNPDIVSQLTPADNAMGTTSLVPLPEIGADGSATSTKIKDNILHNYVNWTYKLGFYMLNIADYNSLIESGDASNIGSLLKNVIFKSGGIGSSRTASGLSLNHDVYPNNLRITSITGNRAQAAATNNVELTMEITEPYSASFIGELYTMATNLSGNADILFNDMPYLLEIDFTGYKDDGSIIKSILADVGYNKKYIPVKIMEIKMKLSASGATYVLTMVPYSFMIFTQQYVIPKQINLIGKTLKDLASKLVAKLNNLEVEKVDLDSTSQIADQYKEIEFKSFDAAGNEVDNEFENSVVAYDTNGGAITSVYGRDMINDPLTQEYHVPERSLVKDVIKNLVLATEYFNKKVDPDNDYDEGRPAMLLKIIPQVSIGAFDPVRKEYAKIITFKVFNTLQFGEAIPYVGNALVDNWGYVKEYSYLFTGKNKDIINCDLDYNLVYYQNYTPNLPERSLLSQGTIATNLTKQSAFQNAKWSKNSITMVPSPIANMGPSQPQRTVNAAIVAEWFDKKLMSSIPDNIQLDLEIIGDPEWIPQDASILGGETTLIPSTLRDKNSSISVDAAGVYVKINFRTSRDYDDKTGLMQIDPKQSPLQGLYSIISVDSTFADGKFTQVLHLVKVTNQKLVTKPKEGEFLDSTLIIGVPPSTTGVA